MKKIRFLICCVLLAADWLAASIASADVSSVMRTDDRYQCVRVADGVVVATSARQDIVQAACAVAVETTRKPHDVKQPTLHFAYVAPTVTQPGTASSSAPAAATMAPQATSTTLPKSYAMLTPICSDAGSVGMSFCQLPPTRFGFPSAGSIVKSDGAWRVFDDLAPTANVLVCPTMQQPGAVADPYRDLCDYAARGDTYVPKSAVLVAPGQTLPAATGSAALSWTPPTSNTDGTPLTDLAGYVVQYGAAADALAISIPVKDASARGAKVENLPSGRWFFAVKAVNAAGSESVLSNVASKVVQ